jgi:hypothetical protein
MAELANPLTTVQCVTCQEMQPKSESSLWVRGGTTYGRCHKCNNVQSRFNSVLKKMEGGNAESLGAMTSEDKRGFLAEHQSLLGAELKVAMVQWAERTQEQSKLEVYATKGEWLDEEELAERFKKKPQQALAIKKNARKHFDPVRECELWEVNQFSSEKRIKTEDRNFRTLTAETRDHVRPAAKAKSAACPSKESKLTKLVSRLKEKTEEHATQLEIANEPAALDWMPTRILQQERTLAAKAKALVAECDLSLSPSYTGSTDDIHQRAGETIVLLTLGTKRLVKCLSVMELEEEDEPEPTAYTPAASANAAEPTA